MHIFCIVGKTQSGKKFFLNNILTDTKFVNKYNLERLIYGTTKKKITNILKPSDKYDYYYMSEKDFKELDENDIVESRSYYTIPEGVVYYFTKREYLSKNNNLICICAPYQFENYKRWCEMENIKHPGRYTIHLIYIHSNIKVRILRGLEKYNSEKEINEFARRILQDSNEFNDCPKMTTELKNSLSNNNVCFIVNNSNSKYKFKNNLKTVKQFIKDSIEKNNIELD